MKKVFLLVVNTYIAILAFAQLDKKIIHAFNNRLTISLPSDVDTMTAAQVQLKYHKNQTKGTLYYANEDLSFSIVILPIGETVKEDDMIKHKDELTDRFAIKGLKLEENEVRKTNNHNLIIVSFYSNIPDGRVFNKRFFAVANGTLFMTTFNCTEEELLHRKSQIEESINSVQIN